MAGVGEDDVGYRKEAGVEGRRGRDVDVEGWLLNADADHRDHDSSEDGYECWRRVRCAVELMEWVKDIQVIERYETFSKVRGSVQMMLTIMPTIVKTMVHVACSVRVFIMMEKVST